MLLQLCYASCRVELEQNLVQDLSDILEKSCSFNHLHDIYGVLYYAEGIYFQCLEGEQSAVEALFQTIAQDRRHHQIHRFPDRMIENIHFKKWSMKYVQQHSRISKFFNELGFKQFSPQQLNPQQLADLLALLLILQKTQHKARTKNSLKDQDEQKFF